MIDELLKRVDENKDLPRDKAFCERLAASLHTFYIEIDCFEKSIMDIIGKSKLKDGITLMPKQLEMLNFIKNNNNVVLSAPTSFGKSFLILEYLKSLKVCPHMIVYVVHTKALCTEVTNNMKDYFIDNYNVVNDFESTLQNKPNIVVTISDGYNIYETGFNIASIDILVIDEAYNLDPNQTSENRFITIYQNCLEYMKKAEKIILIGPFIKNVDDQSNQGYNFQLFRTEYSPVTEMIQEGVDLKGQKPSDKFIDCFKKGENTIAFINSKDKIYEELDDINNNYNLPVVHNDSYVAWMKDYFPDFWVLPKLIEKGLAVYHSSFPKYINLYCMKLFNERKLKGLFTTSAILEGVNTSAKNIVVYSSDSGRRSGKLTPFQFFNLCGRAGRLNQEIVGHIYNFGDTFSEHYNEKSLPLTIGAVGDTPEYKFNLGYRGEETKDVEERIKNSLKQIGIDYTQWYDKYKYYFSNSCEKLERFISTYERFKWSFKESLSNGSLYKRSSTEINKPEILKYIYEHLISQTDYKCKNVWGFSASEMISCLMTSVFGGISFRLRDVCNQSGYIKKVIDNLKNNHEKNMFVVTIMKVAYDYMQYEYNHANVLLKEFISADSTFTDEEREKVTKYYFNRIAFYLKSSESDKVSKLLLDLGVIPPLVHKIRDYLIQSNIDLSDKNNRELLNIVRNVISNSKIHLEDYEKINLESVRL